MGIQGAGSDIMRRSVINSTRGYNLKVILTLHDALYIECDTGDWKAVDDFVASMRAGFTSYFEGTEQYEDSKMIRLDTYAWGDGLKEEQITTPFGNKVDTMPIFIDERAVEEFEHFKSFFMESSGTEAL